MRVKRNLGVVRGIVVRSRSVFGTIGAGLQTLVGGNISLFSDLCEQTRNDAFELMLQHAAALGRQRRDRRALRRDRDHAGRHRSAGVRNRRGGRTGAMKIPFTKAHGAHNDFLLTWRHDAPDAAQADHAEIARAICERHTGVGADGWMLVDPPHDADAEGTIQLYNSDGSMAEISGNGTRCAAAFLIRHGHAAGVVRVRTGAGIKTLRLLRRARSGVRIRDEHGTAGDHGRAFRTAAGGRGRAT